jgi:beta-mannosidase
MEIHPNDPNHGSAHLWEPWNRQDYTNYLTSVPRFATEYGYQSPASYSTIVSAIGESELWEDSAGMRAHQKAMDGKLKLRRAVDIRFHEPKDFDEWHFLTQLEQARALTTAVSHLRAHHDVCSGSVIWQLNDCWPVSSWAIVDFAGQRKPAWHAVRKSYQDVFVAFTGDVHDCAIVIVNDSIQDLEVDEELYAWDFSGAKRVLRRIAGKILSGTFLRVELAEDLKEFRAKDDYLSFELANQTYTKFFEVDKNLNYLPPRFSLNIQKDKQQVQIEIKAETLLRDLCLFPDRIDSQSSVSDNFFTVLPGTSKIVRVETNHPELFSLEAVKQIIRTANDQAK